MDDNPGIDKKPSPALAWFRWPHAMAGLGCLIETGDQKHRDVGEESQGLTEIEDYYDWRYSMRKMARHLTRFASGEMVDAEMKVPHVVCIAWHGMNICNSWLKTNGYDIEDMLTDPNLADNNIEKPINNYFAAGSWVKCLGRFSSTKYIGVFKPPIRVRLSSGRVIECDPESLSHATIDEMRSEGWKLND